jgi:phosphatidylserine decarboxylase
MGVKRDLIVDLVQQLPQGALSRAWGWLARRRRPKAGVRLLQRVFVKATGINMAEASADLHQYPTLEELFVRKLRPGSRRIDPAPEVIVSPVDGTVGASGTVHGGTLLQVKGRAYDLATLLGSDADAARYEGGAYMNVYLSPQDYHRIHTPVAGQVVAAQLIPGGLLPVFAEAVDKVDGLFARNERIITYVDTPNAGRMAVVKVGATLVGRITLAYDPTVWSNRPKQKRRTLVYDPPHLLQKGDELGAFELGSTVVLVAEPGQLRLDAIAEGQKVRMGQRIGEIAALRPQVTVQKADRPRRRKPDDGMRRGTKPS